MFFLYLKGQLVRTDLTVVQFKEIERLCQLIKKVIDEETIKVENIQIFKVYDGYELEAQCQKEDCNSPVNLNVQVANGRGNISYSLKCSNHY